MIRNIFLPETVGSYHLLTQRIVACQVTKSHVKIALVKAFGKKRVIEKILEKSIESSSSNPAQDVVERTVETIKTLLSQIGKFDVLYTVLPANLVVYKDLTVPFSDLNKIKLILPFEIEPLLPFSLVDASLDCIVTDSQKDFSNIFAVAIKKDKLSENLLVFEKAKDFSTKVTVDALELFSLYKFVNPQKKENLIILHMDQHSMCADVIIGGQIKSVRSVPKGIIELYSVIGQSLEFATKITKDSKDSSDNFIQAKDFFSDIKILIDANFSRLPQGANFNKILLMGAGVEIKGLNDLIEKVFSIPCVTFGVSDLVPLSQTISFKGNISLANDSIVSIASALALETTHDFNLNRAYVETDEQKTIFKQLVVAGTLSVLILGAFLFNWFYSARKFNNEIKESEAQIISVLKKEFSTIPKSAVGVDDIIRRSEAAGKEEKNIWFWMSPERKFAFLHYLQELSTRVDVEGLKLTLTKLILDSDKSTGDTMTIEAEVSDYDSLRKFREILVQTKLFKEVPVTLPGLKFSIILDLNKKYDEE
jgi:Tfp pilus assembly PilM family ATPase